MVLSHNLLLICVRILTHIPLVLNAHVAPYGSDIADLCTLFRTQDFTWGGIILDAVRSLCLRVVARIFGFSVINLAARKEHAL